VVVVGATVVVVGATVVVVVGAIVVVVGATVVVVVGAIVVVVVVGAIVVVVGATVVVVVGWVVVVVGATVVVVVGAIVVVVGATVVVVVVGAIVVVVVGWVVVVVVVGAIVVVVVDVVVEVVVVDVLVEVVVELVSVTNAAASGVIFWVVPVCERNPPVAATSGVTLPAGSSGAVEPDWAGPGLLAASKPVSTQKPALVVGAPTPGLPPKTTLMAPPDRLKVAESTSIIPMLAWPPPTPLVVNAEPVLNVESVNVRF
jgi:hypothetical protein